MRLSVWILILFGIWGFQRIFAQSTPTPIIDNVQNLPLDRLITLIQDDNSPSWNPARCELLARGSSPEAVAKLLPLCTCPLGDPSMTAIQILLGYKAKELTPLFIKWCADHNLLATTLDYMDQLGDKDPDQKAALIELFRSSVNREDKGKILALLGKMNAIEMIPEIKTFIQQPGGRSEYGDLALAEMGDRIGVENARKILEDNMTSKYGNYITLPALQALGAIGDKADLGLIDRLQKHFPHPMNGGQLWLDIERFEIQHHGQSPDEQIKALCDILTLPLPKPNLRITLWAINRLAEFNDPKAQVKLIEIATSQEFPVYRQVCAAALLQQGVHLSHHFEGTNCVFEKPKVAKP